MAAKPPIVHSDPDTLGGTPVFVGTRVPVQSLFDYIEGGDTLDEFLHQFPSVKREQAVAALELRRASGRVEAFLTMDRKLERQQTLHNLLFGVIVIGARSNRIQDLEPLVGEILSALTVTRGTVQHVGA
jgi:uncharacterized protein (DUF433 family)